MANGDIQGQVTDGGTGVSGATVTLYLSSGGSTVTYTTTDSNGNYIFNSHPDGDRTSKDWTVVAYYDDGGNKKTTESKPYVSASLPADVEVFVAGGEDPNNSYNDTAKVEKWDGESWSDEPSLPTGVDFADGVAEETGRNAVVVGRTGGSFRWSGGSWSSITDYPEQNDGKTAQSVALANNLNGNVVGSGGGSGFSTVYATVYEYTGSGWNQLASMNNKRTGHKMIKANGKLYAAGGSNGSSFQASVESYDGSSWSSEPSMNTARTDFGLAKDNNDNIYAVAGSDGSNTISSVEKFDGSSWTTVDSLPIALEGHSCASDTDGNIYAISGNTNSPRAFKYDGSSWTEIASQDISHNDAAVYSFD